MIVCKAVAHFGPDLTNRIYVGYLGWEDREGRPTRDKDIRVRVGNKSFTNMRGDMRQQHRTQ
jgi:hypothetical protein